MDARHRDVLIALIREYIDSAEPVGSRALAKRHFPKLSPATIRNVMSDLEEMGYLAQPHTSAGRIPTDNAYRYYVESFPPPQPAAKPAPDVRPAPATAVDAIMADAPEQLSTATHMAGLLLAPPLKRTAIDRVELFLMGEQRALAVLVTESGWLTARAIVLDRPFGLEELRRTGRELTRRFRGRTVEDIAREEAAPPDPLDELHTRGRAIMDQILAMLGGRTLYVNGALNILDHPEFGDLDTSRALLRTFERKERLAELMASLAEDEGVRVTIGEENPYAEMRDCTLITSTYLFRNQVLGILGIVGPRRLPYPDVIAVVEETARRLTDALSRVRQDLYLPS
jgi:heat-inducible transcriptional repressor